MLSVRHHLIRTSIPITTPLINLRPPPLEPLHPAREHEAEKHNHQSERQSRVQRRAQCHRVLRPPGQCTASNGVVKHVADESPNGEVETGGRGDPGQGAEEDGEVDLADDVALAFARVEPEDYRSDGADREAVDQDVVCCFWAEEFAGPDDAPEDAAVEMHASERTCEAVDCLWCADTGDVCEHPVQNADLRDG